MRIEDLLAILAILAISTVAVAAVLFLPPRDDDDL